MTKARNIAELANDISVDSNRDVTLSNLRSDQPMTFRNRIINGDMRISQRNSSNQVTPPTNGDTTQTNNYPVDRWFIQNSSGSATIFGQQVTDVPNGNFQHSVKISTTTAINTTQAQQLNFQQRIEGYNVADFGFGSTSAKSMTFSFYVKSNVLGNYGFIIHNGNVCFVSKYEITTEDVWKKVTINLTPQTSYALSNSTNGTGLYINFDLGCGSDFESNNEGWQTGDFKRPINCIKWANNTNATLYITGVQLEEGTVPTPFEHRPYGTELALCQRYFETSYNIGTAIGTATDIGSCMFISNRNPGLPHTQVRYAVTKRTTPTFTAYNPNDGTSGEMRDVDSSADYGVQFTRDGYTGGTLWTYSSVGLGNFLQFHYTAFAEL